jgi:transposase InsO family protein
MNDSFEPHPVSGFDGTISQSVDLAMRAHLRVQNRLIYDEWFLVVDMPTHDVIVGRKWFDHHDVLVDCRGRRLLFPPEWLPDYYNTDISLDYAASLPRKRMPDPVHQADADRRDAAFDREDKARADADAKRRMEYNRKAKQHRTDVRNKLKAVNDRIDELANLPQQEVPFGPPRDPYYRPKQLTQKVAKRVRFADPVSRVVVQMESVLRSSDNGELSAQKLGKQATKTILKRQPKSDKVGVDSQGPYTLRRDHCGWYKERPMEFATIGAAPFLGLAKESHIGVTSLYEIDRFIQDKRRALEQDEEDINDKVNRVVPNEYHKWKDVFSKLDSDLLPEHRVGVDHKIELTEGSRPEDLKYSPLYKMTLEEAEACRKHIVDNLRKGWIESSQAPWAAPVLFVEKPGGRGLRFCVDYRRLNALTRKDRYPLPLIDETMARIGQAKIFTKIDIRQAFNRIRMATPDDEELTTFRTRYGAYKYKVLPFGLTNGPSTFQRYINDTLMGYLDEFCSAYIDDILIYSNNLAEHRIHVGRVLERLRGAGLQADVDKCEFHVTTTKFLGFIIGVDGITVDPEKVAAVATWKEPTTVKGVQSFLGFCNFYRRFVREYSRIAKPLNNLTCKDNSFRWTEECQLAFDTLKARLLSAPIMAHFDPRRPTQLETDSSDGVVAGVLTQQQDDGEWHPVGYFSETMHGAEHNYPIHDKELLAVIRSLRFWRAELVGLQDVPFSIVTDHQALEYFSTKRLLNMRQAGWAEQLAQYHFIITYRPGTLNAGADALSRKAEDIQTQKERKEAQRTMRIFKPVDSSDTNSSLRTGNLSTIGSLDANTSVSVLDNECKATLNKSPVLTGHDLVDEVIRANKTDPELEVYREKARQDKDNMSLSAGHLLLYKDRLVVSANDNLRTKVIEDIHSRLVGGHPGKNKTRREVSRYYWWQGWSSDVDRYVANCLCQAAKSPRDKTPGLLQPLPIPLRPWRHLVVDFKAMPKDKKGYDNVLVIIDRLSKLVWCTPCQRTATARIAARMYYDGPWRLLGNPESVVSDRGPQFIADYMDEMSKIMGVKWKLSSPGHSQTAGQAEIMNQYLDQRLRPFINHYQDNWSDLLPAMDFVQNGTIHDSTGLQPHEVLTGFPMPKQWDWKSRTTELQGLPPAEKLNRTEAQKHGRHVHSYIEYACSLMAKAQSRQVHQANRHRREPDFDVGDEVRVIRKTWSSSTDRPSDKLEYPMTKGHYRIREKQGHSYLLELPGSWQGPRLFHADRLRRHPNNPLPGQKSTSPGSEIVDGEEMWEVEKILGSKTAHGKLYYQVQWKGWDPDPTWYLAANFKNAAIRLRQYHDEYPDKSGPPMRLWRWLDADDDELCRRHRDDNKPSPAGGQTTMRKTRSSKK